jgi:hypothetical protein
MPQPSKYPKRLTFVYDADGTLRGEITYVVGHLLGRLECAMCDISHSPYRRKKSWIAWVDELQTKHGIEVVTLHRNDLALDESLRACIGGRLPAAVAIDAEGIHRFVAGKDELTACGGRLEQLIPILVEAGCIPPIST